MIPHPTMHWNEILAAYADGEFEGRDDLSPLKQRVERWLTENPEAQAELTRIRQLKQLWQQTTPPSPPPQVWPPILAALECIPRQAHARPASWRRMIGVTIAVAASIAVAFTLWFMQRSTPALAPIAEDDLPFSVAAAHEVEILNVEGADTPTLIVGQLPVKGSLELAGLGDVTVNSVQPASRDNMLPDVHVRGPGRPMIWARLDTD